MNTIVCPDREILQKLVAGEFSESDSQVLDEHLLECESCCAVLEELQQQDRMSSLLRAAAQGEESLDNTVQEVMSRLRNLGHLRQAVEETIAPVHEPTDDVWNLEKVLDPPQEEGELGRFGGYRVLRVLGAGGMGLVLEAEDPKLQRRVAMKIMKGSLAADPECHQRFLREARAAAAIEHPQIVTVYQVGEHRGLPFLAMQLLKGESLETRLQREPRPPLAECLRIGREIAEALAEAHRRKLVHRDIKPGNIWLERETGRVKLVDFGLARIGGDIHLTQSGSIIGTPAYMSPEQAQGDAVDGRTDLYSLGALFYRMTTGKVPFCEPNTMAVLMALANQQPKPPRQIHPEIPASLNDLILRLLAKRPEDRCPTAHMVLDAIKAIEAEPRLPTAETASQGTKTPRLRRGWIAAGLAALFLLAAIVVIIRDKEGKEIARVSIPEGNQAEVISDLPVTTELPNKTPEYPQPSPTRLTQPTDLVKPFVLLRDGQAVRRFKTLTGALAESKDHDVVEIDGPGPHIIDGLQQAKKPVHLRAAPGVRPRLVTSGSPSGGYLLSVGESLTLDGLDLDFRGTNLSSYGERCEFRNCRFIGWESSFAGSEFTASDSLFLGISFVMTNPKSVRIQMDNCIINNSRAIFVFWGKMESVQITLTRNSIHESVVHGGSLLNTTEKMPIEVRATGNIFYFTSGHSEFFTIPEWRTELGKSLRWTGENNIYSGTLFWITGDDQQGRPATLDDWNQLLGQAEPGARFVLNVDWPIANLNYGTIEMLRPFLASILADARQQFNIPDLGPDLSQLGPGEPYLKFLEREGRPPEELRPEVLLDGAFVILRDGQDSVGYRTLQEAVDAAVDGDVIELRTDEQIGNIQFRSSPGRTLTLRGSPGYRPILGGVANIADDRLILENLTFDAGVNIHGSNWDGQDQKFTNPGGIHRVSHCEFLKSAYLSSRFVPLDGKMPRIEYCRLLDVHFGLAADVQLELRDCMLRSVHTGCMTATPGQLDLERCVVWNMAPRTGEHSPGASFNLQRDDAVTVRRSFLTGFKTLYYHEGEPKWEPSYNWHGEHNVYAVREFSYGSGGTFAQWKGMVSEEKDSAENFPPLADPKLWKLTPGTAGADNGPNEEDRGAEISRVGVVRKTELKSGE